MSQRTKKYLLISMIALLIGAGLIVGCVSQHVQTNQKTDVEGAPTINTNPEVIWGDSQWYNPIGKAYETSFKIPERYALRPYQAGNGKYIPRSLALMTPDLKPLPEERQDCRSTTQLTAECVSNVMEIEFGHDLNRQVFKDMGVNEDNYLNYYFDKNRGESIAGMFSEPQYEKYFNNDGIVFGLQAYSSSLDLSKHSKSTWPKDFYFQKDGKKNVLTAIECTNKKLDIEYRGLGMVADANCIHRYIIKPYKMQLFIVYERQYLPQWQQIQNSVTNLINQFHEAATAPQR